MSNESPNPQPPISAAGQVTGVAGPQITICAVGWLAKQLFAEAQQLGLDPLAMCARKLAVPIHPSLHERAASQAAWRN